MIPMLYSGRTVSLQAIYKNGSKRFLQGGRVKGCYHLLNNVQGRMILCEGFATASTLQEAYPDDCVVAAFTAGNILPVAQAMQPDIVAADNDIWTEGNPGLKAARTAATITGATIWYPDFTGLDISSKPSDYNDYINLGGEL